MKSPQDRNQYVRFRGDDLPARASARTATSVEKAVSAADIGPRLERLDRLRPQRDNRLQTKSDLVAERLALERRGRPRAAARAVGTLFDRGAARRGHRSRGRRRRARGALRGLGGRRPIRRLDRRPDRAGRGARHGAAVDRGGRVLLRGRLRGGRRRARGRGRRPLRLRPAAALRPLLQDLPAAAPRAAARRGPAEGRKPSTAPTS